MTIATIGKILAGVGVAGSALPVLVGAYRFGSRPVRDRATWVWMAVGLASNLWMMVAAAHTRNNTDLGELVRSTYTLTGLFALGEIAAVRKARNWVLIAGGLYLAFWIWRAIEADFAQAFSPWTGPALSVMFTAAGVALLAEELRRAGSRPYRSFGFQIAIGTIVMYAPAAAIESISFLLYADFPQTVLVLWTIRGVFIAGGLACFTLAFVWTIPGRPSSESLPTAA